MGATATFTVAATGTGTLTYQWLRNGVAIAGATGSSYTTGALAATDNGASISVIVTSSNGKSTTSNAAVLTISASGSGTGGVGDLAAIDAGSPTAVGNFKADATCPAGAAFSPGQIITIPAGIATTAAPEKVCESACQGNQTYTLAGLISGNNYTVVLHFAELYFPTAGARQFNTAINGTPVPGLQNFDILWPQAMPGLPL